MNSHTLTLKGFLFLVLTVVFLLGGTGILEAQTQHSEKEEVPNVNTGARGGEPDPFAVDEPREDLTERLNQTILPHVEFKGASIQEVCLHLIATSMKMHPKKKGIDIVLRNLKKPKPVSLDLRMESFMKVLKTAADEAGLEIRIETAAVVLASEFEDPNAFHTQVFEVPLDFFARISGAEDYEDSPSNAIEAMSARGIEFPSGSRMVQVGEKLLMRNTRENLELVEAITGVLDGHAQPQVHVRVEFYALPKLDALELVERYDGKSDWRDAVVELRDLVKSGKATLEACPALVAKQACRAKVEVGYEHDSSELSILKEGGAKAVERSTFRGTYLEVDPLVGSDYKTIDITIAISRTLNTTGSGKEVGDALEPGNENTVEAVAAPNGSIQTALNFIDGQTRLLGTLSTPRGDEERTILVLGKVWIDLLVEEP